METNKSQIVMPTRFIDAYLVTPTIFYRKKVDIDTEFKELKLTLIEQRLMIAIFSIYTELNYNGDIVEKGVNVSLYKLCKAMNYPKSIGSSDKKIVRNALKNLGNKFFTIHIKIYEETRNKKNFCSVYTEDNLLFDFFDENKLIHIKLNPIFIKKNYFKLIDSDIYLQLKELLKSDNRKVSKYHFNFILWLLKQNQSTKPKEINIGKLSKILKFPQDKAHKHQIRKKIRNLYEDFHNLGFISMFEIDQKAKNGDWKDIIKVNL